MNHLCICAFKLAARLSLSVDSVGMVTAILLSIMHTHQYLLDKGERVDEFLWILWIECVDQAKRQFECIRQPGKITRIDIPLNYSKNVLRAEGVHTLSVHVTLPPAKSKQLNYEESSWSKVTTHLYAHHCSLHTWIGLHFSSLSWCITHMAICTLRINGGCNHSSHPQCLWHDPFLMWHSHITFRFNTSYSIMRLQQEYSIWKPNIKQTLMNKGCVFVPNFIGWFTSSEGTNDFSHQ